MTEKVFEFCRNILQLSSGGTKWPISKGGAYEVVLPKGVDCVQCILQVTLCASIHSYYYPVIIALRYK